MKSISRIIARYPNFITELDKINILPASEDEFGTAAKKYKLEAIPKIRKKYPECDVFILEIPLPDIKDPIQEVWRAAKFTRRFILLRFTKSKPVKEFPENYKIGRSSKAWATAIRDAGLQIITSKTSAEWLIFPTSIKGYAPYGTVRTFDLRKCNPNRLANPEIIRSALYGAFKDAKMPHITLEITENFGFLIGQVVFNRGSLILHSDPSHRVAFGALLMMESKDSSDLIESLKVHFEAQSDLALKPVAVGDQNLPICHDWSFFGDYIPDPKDRAVSRSKRKKTPRPFKGVKVKGKVEDLEKYMPIEEE